MLDYGELDNRHSPGGMAGAGGMGGAPSAAPGMGMAGNNMSMAMANGSAPTAAPGMTGGATAPASAPGLQQGGGAVGNAGAAGSGGSGGALTEGATAIGSSSMYAAQMASA